MLWAICAASLFLLRPVLTAGASLLPGCAWRSLTGWPCPGCGTTRAVLHLLNGDPAGALAHNPLATAAALVFVLGGLLAPLWLLCGGRAPAVSGRPGILGIATAAFIVLANWAWVALAGL